MSRARSSRMGASCPSTTPGWPGRRFGAPHWPDEGGPRAVRGWTPEQIAAAAGARLITSAGADAGPERVVIDSRQAGPGALFAGLPGAHVNGGRFAAQALRAGAWGVMVDEASADDAGPDGEGVVLAAAEP